MAETKRAMIATPRVGTPSNTSGAGQDVLKTLTSAIGARIRLTIQGSSALEGTLFTACPILNVVALNTSSTPAGVKGDYRIIPLARIQNVQITTPADPSAAAARQEDFSPGKIDTARLKERAESRVRKIKDEVKKQGKGVSAEGQALFNALDRMFPTIRWHDAQIIVDESVIIEPPYRPEDCKAPKEKQQPLAHIKRVVEGERRKIARGTSPLPRKGG